ncbi:CAP domain-containing protein [Dehalobacter sp. MCB1]|uniref:CAP domain-containing protein n=1 Tax=Dehalobacter sp. MCB1 TaxID=1844756 RepID=UPI001FA979D0|nr:CAP domain-containing protein [Dehalobacter sp. MCB1]
MSIKDGGTAMKGKVYKVLVLAAAFILLVTFTLPLPISLKNILTEDTSSKNMSSGEKAPITTAVSAQEDLSTLSDAKSKPQEQITSKTIDQATEESIDSSEADSKTLKQAVVQVPETISETPKSSKTSVPQTSSSEEANPNPPEPAASPSTNSEIQQMLALINSERSKAGISSLELNPKLTNAAQLKAEDMVSNNYFSHISPTWGSTFTLLHSLGITYSSAAENLAGDSSVEAAHLDLMNSEGHRDNIVDASYASVGIGISKSPVYGYVFVQIFTD